MLEPSKVVNLDYNELRISNGNKVLRVRADTDAGDPNAPNNSEDAVRAESQQDAKSATPQRDNRSATEAPTAHVDASVVVLISGRAFSARPGRVLPAVLPSTFFRVAGMSAVEHAKPELHNPAPSQKKQGHGENANRRISCYRSMGIYCQRGVFQ